MSGVKKIRPGARNFRFLPTPVGKENEDPPGAAAILQRGCDLSPRASVVALSWLIRAVKSLDAQKFLWFVFLMGR